MERTPLVAGNWKMFKTRAEAAGFCAELLAARWTSSTRSISRSARPSPRSTCVAERARRRRRRASGRQNVHEAIRGRVHGRGLGAMLVDAGATGVAARPLRAPRALRRDGRRRSRASSRPRSRPGSSRCSASARARPSATAGRPRAVLRHAARRRPGRARRASQVLQVTIAYEPVWAIGTGRTRDARDRPGGARVHPRRARRALRRGGGGRAAHPLRRLGQARQRRASCSPSRTSTARSWAAPASSPASFAAIARAALAG